MNLASSREPAFGVEETRLRGFLHQLVRDRTPMEVGCEYMAARFRVSIWVYGRWRPNAPTGFAGNDASICCVESYDTFTVSTSDCRMRCKALCRNVIRSNRNSGGFQQFSSVFVPSPNPILESAASNPASSEKPHRQANLIGSSRRASLKQGGFCCETGIGLVDSQSMVLLLTRD